MSKKLFKRMIPDIKKIQEHKFLKIFGKLLLDPNLWHFNRYSVATAFSIAFFCDYVPLPIHTPLALFLAIVFRANIPITVVVIWLNTPITYVPIFYSAFLVGSFLLGTPATGFHFEMSLQWIDAELAHIWAPFLLGCLICGIGFAILGNLVVRLLWRCSVSRNWKKRQARRNPRPHPP